MSIVTKALFATIVFLFSFASALALEDTPANRAAQADYYLGSTPPKALFEDMAEKVAASLPADQRAGFKALMTKHLDIDALTKAMRAALIKSFTADELKALGDFYGSPVGKSAMAKFGTYMTEMMPTMQTEMTKAITASQREMTQPK
jgi:hypothetical protein